MVGRTFTHSSEASTRGRKQAFRWSQNSNWTVEAVAGLRVGHCDVVLPLASLSSSERKRRWRICWSKGHEGEVRIAAVERQKENAALKRILPKCDCNRFPKVLPDVRQRRSFVTGLIVIQFNITTFKHATNNTQAEAEETETATAIAILAPDTRNDRHITLR